MGRTEEVRVEEPKVKKQLPSLKVTQDHTLKSCLSPSLGPKNTNKIESFLELDQSAGPKDTSVASDPSTRPIFLSEVNDISPINHGLKSTPDPVPATTPNRASNGSSETADKTKTTKTHLLIGVTGCMPAHHNIFLIIETLFEMYTRARLEIQVVLTKSAEWFLAEKLYKFEKLGVKVWRSDDAETYYLAAKAEQATAEPGENKQAYDLCPEIQKWTDVLLLAPLSANTLAKIINGLADNLLTDLLRTWPIPSAPVPKKHQAKNDNTVLTNNLCSPKPIVVALALTNSMYAHPITKRQLAMLQESYADVSILKPVEKCVDVDGNISMGGMRAWREVVQFVSQKLGEPEGDDNGDDDEDTTDASVAELLLDANPEVEPIIEYSQSGRKVRSSRSNTLTNHELQEHEKLALQNAVLNCLPHG